MDINYYFHNTTPLHAACKCGRLDVDKLLLTHPSVDVNCINKKKRGKTPLHYCVVRGYLEVMKLLLADPRSRFDITDMFDKTTLQATLLTSSPEPFRWFVALRGNDLKLNRSFTSWSGNLENSILLNLLLHDRSQAIHNARVKLRLPDAAAAELFALIVFLCDDFLRIKTTTINNNTARFFQIAKRLPMELQMVLCHRTYHSAADSILSSQSEPAFRCVAKSFANDLHVAHSSST
jgi:hypothetical protein